VGLYFGLPAIVKERFSKKYRHPIIDERLNKERLKGEVRSLIRY
jgi:TP53 regulating kinase-like protein